MKKKQDKENTDDYIRELESRIKDLEKKIKLAENQKAIKMDIIPDKSTSLLNDYRTQQDAILNSIPHLTWLKDKHGRYIAVSESFATYYNLKREDIIGKTDYDFCPKEVADKYAEVDNEILNTGTQKYVTEIYPEDYKVGWYETFKTPIYDDQGEIIGISGISRDITKQKQAEEELRKSEEKFRDLVRLLPEVIYEVDLEGYLRFVNLEAFKKLGYFEEDFTKGIYALDLVAPEDHERAARRMNRIFSGEDLEGTEYKILTRDGKKLPVLIYSRKIVHENKVVGLRGVMVDISERIKAEMKEKEYQKKLLFLSNTALDFLRPSENINLYKVIGEKLAQLVPNSIVVISQFHPVEKELEVRYTSGFVGLMKKVIKILGYKPLGKRFPITDDTVQEIIQTGSKLHCFKEGLYESSVGQIPKPVSNALAKLVNARDVYGMSMYREGYLYGTAIIITTGDTIIEDSTVVETFILQASIALQRQHLEHELSLAKGKAEESDKLKTTFLANISHEIRTPMNGILGLAQLLTEKSLDPEKRSEYLRMIKYSGNVLLQLLDGILDISKIESNQIDIKKSEFSVNELIQELYTYYQSEKILRKKERINIIKTISLDDGNSFIYTDPVKLRQILSNLINNALKFTSSGNIEFGYRLDEDEKLLFFVSDSGIGIHEDKLDSIFERFSQADDSLTRQHGGSGLGLAISKGFVELLGGKIWATSKYGEGSTFYFTLPFEKAARENTSIKDITLSETNDWSTFTILVVEDDFVNFKLLEGLLKKMNASILRAQNGKEAVEIALGNEKVDLILMDIQLPELNGYEATKQIKQKRPALPVLVITANTISDERVHAEKAGCDGFIQKPINFKHFTETIQKLLSVQ